jgi:hypothetical protein
MAASDRLPHLTRTQLRLLPCPDGRVVPDTAIFEPVWAREHPRGQMWSAALIAAREAWPLGRQARHRTREPKMRPSSLRGEPATMARWKGDTSMASFADLSAENPNPRQQYDEWRSLGFWPGPSSPSRLPAVACAATARAGPASAR